MAAGSEVPQKGVLQASGYSPVKTDLSPPIQLPGTGELWANVGKTALAAAQQAGTMLQNSRLNPAVAAQQDYQQTQYDTAADRITELASTRAGRMTMGTDQGGLTTVPAARTDIDPMIRMTLRSAPATPARRAALVTTEESKPTVEQQKQAEQQDFQQHPENYIQNPSTGNYERRQDVPPASTTTTTPATQPKKEYTPGDELTQANVDAGVKEALSRNQFASSDQGIPANYQPPQQGGGSIYSPMRPAPLAPAAPGAPPPDQASTPGTVPGSLSDQFAQQAQKEQLSQWQSQNIHPVVAPAAFLKA